MPDPPLDVADLSAGVALIPGAIELLGCSPELHDEVAGQVLRLSVAPFLPPQAEQGGFIATHDDPGVRTADERLAAGMSGVNRRRSEQKGHDTLPFSWARISAAALRITPSVSAKN